MYNFQAIISKGTNNSLVQFERFGTLAQNLSNIDTNGYKKVTFEQILKEDGCLTGAVRTDYSQGSIRVTENPYDVGIDGPGFIPVTSPSGEVQYTRDGSFKQGKDGYMVTSDGWLVGDGIKVPSNCMRFDVRANGEVYAYFTGVEKAQKIGTIPLIRFENPDGMQATDMDRLIATEDAGEAKLVRNHNCFKQGTLERANVNQFSTATDLMRMNASMLASMQILKLADQMYNKAINIREG